MNFTTILQIFAYVPMFALRPFLPAFLISVAAFLGEAARVSSQTNAPETLIEPSSLFSGIILFIIERAPHAPAWFIHPIAIGILGLIAFVEFFARKDQDVRLWLEELDEFVKSAVYLVVSFSLVDAESAAFLNTIVSQGGDQPTLFSTVGYALSCVWAVFTSVITWAIAVFRKGFLMLLAELDEDDTLGLQALINWTEDFGVFGGVILATIFPLVALLLFGFTLFCLFLFEKYLEYQEKKRLIPCPNCREPIQASAPTCYNCGVKQAPPMRVGVFGQATQKPVVDLRAHKLQLVTKKRCPVCATRLKKKAIRQHCSQCGKATFGSAKAVDYYLQNLRQELPKMMIVTFILGLIPVIGIIPAIIYYRFSLIASLRGYIPKSIGCLARWGVRLLNMSLISLQPIPLLGAFVLPLMVVTNYFIYQKIIERERNKHFGRSNTNKKPPSAPPVSNPQIEIEAADDDRVRSELIERQ